MTEHHDDLDRSLTERLRAYENRIPVDAAPDLNATGQGARRPSTRLWGALAAAGGVVVGLVLALSFKNLVPPPTGEASATPQPTSSPAATPLATPPASAAPSLTLAPAVGLLGGDQLLAIAQVDGRLIAVGQTWEAQGGVWTSPDGGSWALVPNLPTTEPLDFAGTRMTSIVDGPAGLVAAGSYYAIDFSSPRIWYSADGERWTSVYGPSDPARGAFGSIAALAVGGPGYVAVGITSDDGFTARPQIWTSANGREWVVVDSQLPMGSLDDVIEGGGMLVAVGDRGAVVSADGATWTAAPEQEALLGANMTSVAFRNGIFVASGLISGSGEPTPAIWSSPDGLHWTLVERGVSGQRYGQLVATDAGFVAIGGEFPSLAWQYDPAAPIPPPRDTVQLWFSADGEAWTGPTTGFVAEGGITLGRGAVSGGDILVPVTLLVPEGPAPSPAILYGPLPTT